MKKKNGKMVPNCVPEAIDPFMISYSRYGKHAGFLKVVKLYKTYKRSSRVEKERFYN